MFLYFIVIARFHDNIKYGCNEGSHLLGIFTDEQKAKAIVKKYLDFPEHDPEIGYPYKIHADSALEKDYNLHEIKNSCDGGSYDIYYEGFTPGMVVGGGFYIE